MIAHNNSTGTSPDDPASAGELLTRFLDSKKSHRHPYRAWFHRPGLCFIHKNPRRPAPRSGAGDFSAGPWKKIGGGGGRRWEGVFHQSAGVELRAVILRMWERRHERSSQPSQSLNTPEIEHSSVKRSLWLTVVGL